MGLDMYLTKKTFIGSHHDLKDLTGKIEITIKGTPVNINFQRVESIHEQVGYWRKANQIHRWFVENVQDGEDDCGSYRVSKEKFQQLLHDVQTVLDAKGLDGELAVIKSFLPPSDGFFFGSIDISEYYWSDLEYTRDTIISILNEMEIDEKSSDAWIDYFYQSSW